MTQKMNEIEQRFYNRAVNYIIDLKPQKPIDKYRVDFLVEANNLIIEIDGHDFHKTREQRTNDAKRQRKLQNNGYTVIRFTGTEVYKYLDRCINDVIRTLDRLTYQKKEFKQHLLIDAVFLNKQVFKFLANHKNHGGREITSELALSKIIEACTKYLKCTGEVEVFIFTAPGFLVDSIILYDLDRYLSVGNTAYTINLMQNELVADALGMQLLKIAHFSENKMIVADDQAYSYYINSTGPLSVSAVIRNSDDESNMLFASDAKWQDIDYVIGTAWGLEPHEM